MSAPRLYRERLELLEVQSEEEVERLRQMMAKNDIWKDLSYVELPPKGKFFLRFFSKGYGGHLIREVDSGREIGFFLLSLGRIKSLDRVEVDIAIPDPELRGQGVNKRALFLLFDLWLIGDRVGQIFCRTTPDNAIALQSARGLDLDIHHSSSNDEVASTGGAGDNRADPVFITLTREKWSKLREAFGAPPFVAPEGSVYPPRASSGPA